jgi:ParB family chromosome partitioning protein
MTTEEHPVVIEPRRRLGRGLDALFGAPLDQRDETPQRQPPRTLPIAAIAPNPRNPRREFATAELEELASSVRKHGLVQPLVVRSVEGGSRFEIVAGERRWRAAQLAGLHEVPVAVVDASDREALELAIVENVQRVDLNPVEEARGYQALIEEFGYTQADLASSIGKSRVHVTNTLRLLKLPGPVLAMLESGALSAGHGRALLAGNADAERLAATIIAKNLSVRDTERLAQGEDAPVASPRLRPSRDADVMALERELADLLGLKVELRHQGGGRGEIRIAYRSLDQLDLICRKLKS